MENRYKALPMHLRDRLQKGNAKIDSSVGIFNLPAVKSCLNCESCQATCYAKQRELMYANVRTSREYNLNLAKTDIQLLQYCICKQLDKGKIKVVRIHESGDFVNEQYIVMWTNIARKFPAIQFYAYTKVWELFPRLIGGLNSLYNVNIINSLIDNNYRNYGDRDYLEMLKGVHPDIFICPADNKDIKCMKDCKACLKKSKVCFEIHGNYRKQDTYKAEVMTNA